MGRTGTAFDRNLSKVRGVETLVLGCEGCGKQTAHFYVGNFGCISKPKHVYECLICENVYESSKRLKIPNLNLLMNT